MSDWGKGRAAAASIALATLAATISVEAQAPEIKPIPTFAVRTVDANGTERDTFGNQNPLHFDIQFVLSLSASDRYATTITLIQDASGHIEESVLFQGSLSKGVYRFLTPAVKPAGKGEIKAKIIMKTRFFPRKFTGESLYIYRQWEGAYLFGR